MTKVLIVEDEPALLDLCTTMIEELGYEVFQALDPDEALEQFMVSRPKYVISDLQMPGIINAEQFIKKIKIVDKDLVVFMVTSMAVIPDWVSPTNEKNIEKWALSIGVNEFIEKPYSKDEFESRLKKYQS